MNTENSTHLFKSELKSLSKISTENLQFNIPIYQRLYVWQAEQIQTLLEDLVNHFKVTPNEDYFLGTVVVVKNGDVYDLIDGQQRFTTLWLILKALEDTNFASSKRLQFAIRPHASAYFDNPASSNEAVHVEMENIKTAQITIKNLLNEEVAQLLKKNIPHRVKIIFTEVPQKVDLNKLFEAFNSGGVQLQQHELLKAKLLKYLSDDKERHIYEKMWTTCSWMNTYIEEGIVLARGGSKSAFCDALNLTEKETSVISAVRTQLLQIEKDTQQESFSVKVFLGNVDVSASSESTELQHILGGTSDVAKLVQSNASIGDEIDKCRSIIGFPLLLLHCLKMKIYQKSNAGTNVQINDKKLLNIFDEVFFKPLENESEEAKTKKVKDLIETIWKVRVLFDRWVIKWVKLEDSENEEMHSIQSLTKSTNDSGTYLRRSEQAKEEKALSILQSMLYHTQEQRTQYWLTPFLYKLVENPELVKTEEIFNYLQQIDNQVLSSEHRGKDKTLSERSWEYMGDVCDEKQTDFLTYIKKTNEETPKDGKWDYHRFSQYDLNKIDFILWFNSHTNINNDWTKVKDKYDSYQFLFRRRNSIEHVAPQKPDTNEENSKISQDDKLLHGLGNLVLLSSSDNSSQRNKGFNQKMSWLMDQNEWFNHPKLLHIYSVSKGNVGNWDEKSYQAHLSYVYEQIEQYQNALNNVG